MAGEPANAGFCVQSRGVSVTRLLVLLSICLLALRGVAGAHNYAYRGRIVVFNEPRRGQQLAGNVTYHFLRADKGILYALVLPPQVAQLDDLFKTGDAVEVTADLDLSGPMPESAAQDAAAAGPPGTLYVVSASGGVSVGAELNPNSQVYYTGNGRLSLRTAVWVVNSVCGLPVQGGMTVQDVSEVFFGPAPGAALLTANHGNSAHIHAPAMTLNRLWDECSYGAVQIKRKDVVIMGLDLPCSGVRPNGAVWNVTRGSAAGSPACGMDELLGWMEYAAATAVSQGVFTSPLPYRRVLLLPTPGSLPGTLGGLCSGWQQRGTYGCDESRGCDIWIKADPAQLLERLTTQIGSSMTLRPANATAAVVAALGTPQQSPPPPPLSVPAGSGGFVADSSCPMGSADGEFKCFSGPNAFKLLFSSALTTLNSINAFIGLTLPVQLPAAGSTTVNLLLVDADWTTSTPPYILYGQYRAPVGPDSGLLATVRGRVLIHGVPASEPPAGPFPAPATVLLAALSEGQTYRYDSARVLFRVQRVTPPPASDPGGVSGGSATVAVCRYSALRETGVACRDGIDNDCDGLVDSEDPDCKPATGRHHY